MTPFWGSKRKGKKMKTIYKYPVSSSFELLLPEDAEILTVQLQDGEAQMWVLFDPYEPTYPRKFEVFGTGWTIEEDELRYVATFQKGKFVWHVFEVVNE